MNEDNQLVPVDPAAAPLTVTETADLGAAPEMVNPLQKLHRLLDGRYHWAALFGLVGLILCAGLGYKLPTVKYRSAGEIDGFGTLRVDDDGRLQVQCLEPRDGRGLLGRVAARRDERAGGGPCDTSGRAHGRLLRTKRVHDGLRPGRAGLGAKSIE